MPPSDRRIPHAPPRPRPAHGPSPPGAIALWRARSANVQTRCSQAVPPLRPPRAASATILHPASRFLHRCSVGPVCSRAWPTSASMPPPWTRQGPAPCAYAGDGGNAPIARVGPPIPWHKVATTLAVPSGLCKRARKRTSGPAAGGPFARSGGIRRAGARFRTSGRGTFAM